MKNLKAFMTVLILIAAAAVSSGQTTQGISLNAQLLKQDSILFDAALKTCKIADIENVLASEYVYKQDKGDGSPVSNIDKTEFINRIKSRCGRKGPSVKRIVSDEQAFPVSNDRADETGIQRFYIVIEGQPDELVETSRFSRSWKKTGKSWLITQELNYPANPLAQEPDAKGSGNKNTPLFALISKLDSDLFKAYNDRDLKTFLTFFDPGLEFYHDKGGFTNFEQNKSAFTRNFSDPNKRLRRELVQGTLEVYPIGDYGALEIGVHRFYRVSSGSETYDSTAKFAEIWKKVNGKWLLSREISYDHQ